MAEGLPFEKKIEGLVNYYHTLAVLDPQHPNHAVVANPDYFFSEGIGFRAFISKALRHVAEDMAIHARLEYTARGFDTRDLREDTEEELSERADVLAVVTSPVTKEVRSERQERIAGLLGDIAAGKKLLVRGFGLDNVEEVTPDLSREIYAGFIHPFSDHPLVFRYDYPSSYGEFTNSMNRRLLEVDLDRLFRAERAPVEAAA